METISISVNVNIDFSEKTMTFIKSLFGRNTLPAALKPAEQKPAEQKPAEQKPAEQKPAEQKPAEQKPAEQKPADGPSIEDLRTELTKKVGSHREAIKAKLNELGSPSITKLDPAKYTDMYNFLKSL